MYKLGNRSLERLEGVTPILVDSLSAALAHPDCPHDVGIPQLGGLRSVEDQQGLFAIGRTVDVKKRSIITKVDGVNNKSNHQAREDGYGYAIDIYNYEDGKANWDKFKLEVFARHWQKVAKEEFDLDLKWGGDWKWKDRPHFELPKNYLAPEVDRKVIEAVANADIVPADDKPGRVTDSGVDATKELKVEKPKTTKAKKSVAAKPASAKKAAPKKAAKKKAPAKRRAAKKSNPKK